LIIFAVSRYQVCPVLWNLKLGVEVADGIDVGLAQASEAVVGGLVHGGGPTASHIHSETCWNGFTMTNFLKVKLIVFV
jgi:hypothetical protein